MASIAPEKLTAEYLREYADTQTQLYLDTEHVDENRAEQLLAKAYEVAGLSAPKECKWYDSPEAFAKDPSVRDSVRASVRASVRDSVWASVRDSVWASVRDSVRDSVRASVRASVRDSVWASVGDSVWASVGDSVWASVRDSVWASVGDSVRALLDANWLSFYKFFNDNLENNNLEHLCLFSEMVNGYLLTADVAYIVRKPIRLVRSPAGRLHYDHGMAIEWADGTGYYYLHGVEFKKEDWERIVSEEITLPEFAKMGLNNEQRPAALQMLRADRLLEQVNAKLIHTGRRKVELYEVPNFMDTGETEYCMKMEHPSIKGKLYLEWVRPEIGRKGDADVAMASNRGITKAQYLGALVA